MNSYNMRAFNPHTIRTDLQDIKQDIDKNSNWYNERQEENCKDIVIQKTEDIDEER